MDDKIYGNCKIFFRIIFAVFAVSIMCLIFYMSSQNAVTSAKTSGELIIKLSKLFISGFSEKTALQQQVTIKSLQFIVRKSAHFLIYLGLGFCFGGFFSTFNIKQVKLFIISLFLSVIYSVSDEIHQLFSKGRSAEIRDVLIDSVGAIIGILLLLSVLALIKRIKQNQKQFNGGVKVLKRKLILQNKLLEEKLCEANSLISSLNDEIAVLNDKLKLQTAEIEKLHDEPSKENTENSIFEAVSDDIDNVETGFNVTNDFLIDSEVIDIKNQGDSDVKDFAVSAVAKIILECTKADMTVMSSNSLSKDDDRNIILGSAEASKTRIFEILGENLTDSDAKLKIDAELNNYLNKLEKILQTYN